MTASPSTSRSGIRALCCAIIVRSACSCAAICLISAAESKRPIITIPRTGPCPVPSSTGDAASIKIPRFVCTKPVTGRPALKFARHGKSAGSALRATKSKFRGCSE